MTLNEQAAEVLELLKREGQQIASDHKADASDYVREGLVQMREQTSGLDPSRYAPELGMQAARYYAAHKLAAGGLRDRMFAEHRLLYEKWKRRGRVAQHRERRRDSKNAPMTPFEEYQAKYTGSSR